MLDEAWDHAAISNPHATPFQRRAWLQAWVDAVSVAEGKRPIFLRIPDDGPPTVGLALQLEEVGGERRLTHLAAPWVDYQEAVGTSLASSALDDGAASLAALARQHEAVICFGDVRAGGLLEAILRRLPGQFSTSSELSSVDLAHLSHLQVVCGRREHAIKRRRLQRRGHIELVRHQDLESIKSCFPTFVALHTRQWEGRADAVAPFSIPAVRSGFEALLYRSAEQGFADLTELRLNGDAIASYIGFQDQKTYYAYRTTYDVRLKNLSPGHIMLQELMYDLAAQGMETFDFMRGGYSYKAQYASSRARNLAWRAGRP